MPDVGSRQVPTPPKATPDQGPSLALVPTVEPTPLSAEPSPTLDAQASEDTRASEMESPPPSGDLPTAEAAATETATPEPTATPTDEQPAPSPTPTQRVAPTSTATSVPLPTNTSAPRGPSAPTSTPPKPSTPTWTPRPANTPTWTPRPANTPTYTPAATSTPRPTATKTSTPKPTATKTSTPKPTATKASGGTYNPAAESLALSLINSSRSAAGLKALTSSSAIQQVARAYAMDMATRNYFSHTSPEGLNVWNRLTNAGIAWTWCAENLAMGSGFATPSDAIRTFHASMMGEVAPNDGHRKNILSTKAGRVGIGVVQTPANKVYYVTNFTN